MSFVRSSDGTRIAFSRAGSGPAVVLVGGGLDDGSENAPLAEALAGRFTVYNYARRGRGASGDAPGYGVEREVEDIEALISEAGGSACLFGASSGGALVLEAAARRVAALRIAVYEVPYSIGAEATQAWAQYVERLEETLFRGEMDEALASFMRLAGSSDADVEAARSSPHWRPLLSLAPTLAYDAAVLGDGSPPVERLRTIVQPTLVLTGGGPDPHMEGLHADFFGEAADAVAGAIPRAVRRTIPTAGHVADPSELGPELERFFAE